ncbi:methylated-DNA--[protein]-cysteine S-methyltransferase [Aporhodopirellula aestuarii]|uniref:methylated-DNA--[protein]-cysteine S-methyltransferase n=1 Tax=Aporhodopirellula aestuarii TaxID=2950107 RepID=UPI002AFE010B|nr:methylated-DNA--[protein]-cysteine S-methyltransferase [Aporhodopirellula aestuarii]
MRLVQTVWNSPVGELRITVREQADGDNVCVGLYFPDHHPAPRNWCEDSMVSDWMQSETARGIVEQLQAYFDDSRFAFDTPCGFAGTAFQIQVWRQLQTIPPGKTWSYSEIAERIGRPAAVRAVGAAVARNPISIIVPCHRVISRGGGLAGFAGGLDRKRFLLEHESALLC